MISDEVDNSTSNNNQQLITEENHQQINNNNEDNIQLTSQPSSSSDNNNTNIDNNNDLDISSDEEIQNIASLLANANSVHVFTGAGMSAESGIETFRGSSGLWTGFIGNLVLGYFGTPLGWKITPGLCWTQYIKRFYNPIAEAKPNKGHEALAELQQDVFEDLQIITQNVDGLHQRAGSRGSSVHEVHGTVRRHVCTSKERHVFDFNQYFEENPQILEKLQNQLKKEGKERSDPLPESSPKCKVEGCGYTLRPDCVLFTESLPPDDWLASERAIRDLRRDDVLLVIGTSAKVYPAAGLPFYAAKRGAYLVEINLESTSFNQVGERYRFLKGPSGVILPKLVKYVKELRQK
ncbi:hypothetical protein ABK040_006336 [Willaertia magna]